MKDSDFKLKTSDIARFEGNPKELKKLVLDKKYEIDRKEDFKNLKSSYAYFDVTCNISEHLFCKIVSGAKPITRQFLYKFSVGLGMSVDEANQYFILCGGNLDESDVEDCACLRALQDKDTIGDYLIEAKKAQELKPKAK